MWPYPFFTKEHYSIWARGTGCFWKLLWQIVSKFYQPRESHYQRAMATLRIIFFSKEWWYILKVSSIKKFLLTKGLCLNLVLPFMNCYHGALNIRWKDWSEAPIFWPPNAKNWLIWKKTLMLGRLKAQGDNRGRDAWMASPTQWTWVWASSGRWWRTGRPDVLQTMKSQRIRHR